MKKIEDFPHYFLEKFSKSLISQNFLQTDEVVLQNEFNQYIHRVKNFSTDAYNKLNCDKVKHVENLLKLHKRNCQQKIASLVYRITKGAEVEQENAKKTFLSSCKSSQDCSYLLQLLINQSLHVLPELMYFLLEVLEKKMIFLETENVKEYSSKQLLDILISLWSKLQMMQEEKFKSSAEVFRALFSIYIEISLKHSKNDDSLLDKVNLIFDSDKHNFLDVISAIEIDEILISNPDAKKIFVKMYTHVVKENWINASFDNYLKLVTIFKKAQEFLDQKYADSIKTSIKKVELDFAKIRLCYKNGSGTKLLMKYENVKENFSTYMLDNVNREEIDDLLLYYNKEDDSNQQQGITESGTNLDDERMEADFFIDVPSREEDSQVDEERSEKSDEDSDGDLSDDLEIMNSDDDESVALNKSVDELKDLDEAYIDKVDSSDNEENLSNKDDETEQTEVSKNKTESIDEESNELKQNDISLKEENLNILDTEENLQKSEVKKSSSASQSDDDSSFIKTRLSGLIKESDPEEDFDDFVKSSPEKEKVETELPSTPPQQAVNPNYLLRTPQSARKPKATPVRSARKLAQSTQTLRRSTRIRKPTTKF